MAHSSTTKSSKSRPTRIGKVSKVLNQARESLKLLETLEKETLAKAKTFVRNPLQLEQKEQKILAKLKSMGIATRTEVEELENRVESLTQELSAQRALLVEFMQKRGSKTAGAKTQASQDQAPTAETFPNT